MEHQTLMVSLYKPWLLVLIVFFCHRALGEQMQASSSLRFQASMAIHSHCLQAVMAIVLQQASVAEIFSSKSIWLFCNDQSNLAFQGLPEEQISEILYSGSTARLKLPRVY